MAILAGFMVFFVCFTLTAVAMLIASLLLQRKQYAGSAAQLAMQGEDGPGIMKVDEVSSIAPWASILARFDFAEATRAKLAQADLNWSVGRLTVMMLFVGAFSLVIFSRVALLPAWVAFLLACGLGSLPYVYVTRRRAKRFKRFEEQFPDALDFLARSLRAGHPAPVSIELLAQEESPPLAIEMRKTAEERRLGLPLDQALDNLSKRMPILNVRMFVAAVRLQSRTGGKLGEALGGLAENMREAASVEGEVRSLAAHGKVTGLVLTLLPLGIGALMQTVNPGYLNILMETPTGREMIVVCAVALVAAHFVIGRIVDVKL